MGHSPFTKHQAKDTNNDKCLVLGPWPHGQEIGDGSTLGDLEIQQRHGTFFRHKRLRPVFDHYLKNDAPPEDVPPVSAYGNRTSPPLPSPVPAV